MASPQELWNAYVPFTRTTEKQIAMMENQKKSVVEITESRIGSHRFLEATFKQQGQHIITMDAKTNDDTWCPIMAVVETTHAGRADRTLIIAVLDFDGSDSVVDPVSFVTFDKNHYEKIKNYFYTGDPDLDSFDRPLLIDSGVFARSALPPVLDVGKTMDAFAVQFRSKDVSHPTLIPRSA